MAQTVSVASRAQWGAVPPKSVTKQQGPAPTAIVHHTALPKCSGLGGCQRQLLSIQRTHMNERGYDDIAYNFLVACDGTVFEGRGWGVVGAHTKGHNRDSVGIALMGNFNDDTPSSEALASVKLLLQSGVSQGYLVSEFKVVGHQDLGTTECPGDNLHSALSELRPKSE